MYKNTNSLSSAGKSQDSTEKKIKERMDKIKYKLIIMSNKGGVGKSMVSVNLAYGLLFQGQTVGLLDVDIHGPSLGKMVGAENQQIAISGSDGIEPITIASRLKLITMGSFLKDSDTPVIWRGPLKMKLIGQFLGDVNWGELDYLIVDSPPGTGDEPLSVVQLIPGLTGAIIVTTPQEVALLDSRKSVNFIKALKVPVVGIIENMSGLICPHCGTTINLFKTGGGEKAAGDLGVPFLGRIPIDPAIVDSTDEGKPFVYAYGKTATAKLISEIVERIITRVENEK